MPVGDPGQCSFPNIHALILGAVEHFLTVKKKKNRLLFKPQINLYGRIKGNQMKYLLKLQSSKSCHNSNFDENI